MTIFTRQDLLTVIATTAIFAGTALVPVSALAQGQGMGGPPTVTAGNVVCTAPCINSFEIEDGQVGTVDLANDAVTGAKIAPSAVGTSDIADGAVTEAKLSFVPGAPLPRVVFVGGDDTAENNGDGLLDAFDDIGTTGPCSSPGPSATDPCLVKVGPGVFDVGATMLDTIAWVDIEGSGRNVTTIVGDTGSSVVRFVGGNVEIRNLAVAYDGTSAGIASAIGQIGSPLNLRLSHVNATVSTDGQAIGISIGGASTAILTDVSVEVLGGALTNERAIEVGGSANAVMHQVHAVSPDQGLLVANDANAIAHGSIFESPSVSPDFAVGVGTNGSGQTATLEIHGSRILGDIRASDNASMLSIATSQVTGGVTEAGSGVVECVFAYDAAFIALDFNCE